MFDQTQFEAVLARVGAQRHVSADDVLALRRDVFRDGVVTADELDAIFRLAERAPDGAPEWADFFAEVVGDYYLREEEPQGYLTREEFQSLRARVVRDDAQPSHAELRLLVKLLEDAVDCPPEMRGFLAERFRAAARADAAHPQRLKDLAALVRRFVYAKAGDGALDVTRLEAELLFDLTDSAPALATDPGWADFFAKALSAHLMAHFGYRPLPREAARRLNESLADHRVDPGRFLSRALKGLIAGFGARRETSLAAERNSERAAAAAEAEVVTESEAAWLSERIGRDGRLSEPERRLLARMVELGAELPPKLKALHERAA